MATWNVKLELTDCTELLMAFFIAPEDIEDGVNYTIVYSVAPHGERVRDNEIVSYSWREIQAYNDNYGGFRYGREYNGISSLWMDACYPATEDLAEILALDFCHKHGYKLFDGELAREVKNAQAYDLEHDYGMIYGC